MRFPRITTLFVSLVLLTLPALGQSPNGNINGLILDPTNRVIAGAEIVAVNDVTGVQFTTKTNDEGVYVLANMPPGPYRIQVSKLGFKTIIKPDIVLNVQDALSINFTLPVGALLETVTVTGGAPLVNSESASVSTVIDRNFVESLPLNGRSFNILLQLTPGVVIPPAADSSSGQFSVAGQRTDANNFTVDGVSANFGVPPVTTISEAGTGGAQAFSVLGGTSSLVSVEALQEFRVETSSFAPEFGRSPGGQVILVTRSGTNNFHGGIYEYFRNDVLDANDWFANNIGQPRAPERHNDFGGFLGGPLWKNRTFFFASYEGARLRVPQTSSIEVPSAYARTLAAPALVPLLAAYPQPNGQPASPSAYTAPFTGAYSQMATLDAGSIRVDHKINQRFSIFGRFNDAPSDSVGRSQGLSFLDMFAVNTKTVTVGVDMSLTNQIINALRANYSTQFSSNIRSFDSFGGAVPLNPALLLGSLPSANVVEAFFTNDLQVLQGGPKGRNRTQQINVVDDLSVNSARHQFKFGGDYRAIFLKVNSSQYNVVFSSDSVQDFLSTGAANLSISTLAGGRLLAQALSVYAQDTWKIRPRLTLTYGLRWELSPAPSPLGKTALASWNDVNDPAALAPAPAGTRVWNTTFSNLAPRLGVAYSLGGKGDFVLRAGAGIFYDLGVGSSASAFSSFPNSASQFSSGVPQYRTQHQHRSDGEAGCEAHAQNGWKEIGAEIGHFFDRLLERIHDCSGRGALVVVGRKPVQVAQKFHAQPERDFLCGSERQVISKTG
jgi:Carboxypeptidase regulatory-like domain/TonB dependent receptor-like, beta-barrel